MDFTELCLELRRFFGVFRTEEGVVLRAGGSVVVVTHVDDDGNGGGPAVSIASRAGRYHLCMLVPLSAGAPLIVRTVDRVAQVAVALRRQITASLSPASPPGGVGAR
jgi:hypothetical protein